MDGCVTQPERNKQAEGAIFKNILCFPVQRNACMDVFAAFFKKKKFIYQTGIEEVRYGHGLLRILDSRKRSFAHLTSSRNLGLRHMANTSQPAIFIFQGWAL